MHFLVAGDARVAWGIAGTVGSILRVVPPESKATVTIVDGGLPANLRSRIESAFKGREALFRLRFVPFVWPKGNHAPPLEGSRLVYARFFAESCVDDAFCLYLDSDVILRENPAPLFTNAVAYPEVPLWAARNYPHDSFCHQIGRQADDLTANVPASTPYFNSGVLLLNVPLWRTQQLGARALALADQYNFIAHDQDALNVLLRDQWRELPERWNFQLFQRSEFPADTAALHYSGRNKPWHFGYPVAARQPFEAALSGLGWKHWRPRPNLFQWLHNSRLQPLLANWHSHLRRWTGRGPIKRR